MNRSPLPLPPDYDPAAYMIAKRTENGLFHESRAGAALAYRLAANGAPEDLALARHVLDAVLNAQETHAADPHYGNFLWMIEDDVVFDLNAVEFNLEYLVPMMLEYAGRLPAGLQERVLAAIRLGLREIEKLDVMIAYSNITVLDILNTCLGGQLLGDERLQQRGYDKLARWMAFTARHGAPVEYNSPTYTAVVIRALHTLATLTSSPQVRVRARVALARIGLSAALHLHPATGRWAGPHSRAYHPSIRCETPPEIEQFRAWIADGALPRWLESALDARPPAFQVSETAYSPRGWGFSTYQCPSFALGIAAREFGGQSNVAMIHYTRPGAEKPGVFYTRYLLDDKWLGDFYHATDRTKSRNLIEEGRFCGVQDGPRAIGLYTLADAPRAFSSAKAALIWNDAAQVEEIWCGDRRITGLPADLPPGQPLVIGSGGAWMGVLPLRATALGRETPVRLVEKEGDLVLEIYNYLGASKSFWELGSGGPFYQGAPRCGFYLEAAERGEYADGAAFARQIASGVLRDEAAAPFTREESGQRPWQVEYRRAGVRLGLEVELMGWQLQRRWAGEQELGWPMLESPVALERRGGAGGGSICLGEAALSCGPGAGWLYACPERSLYVAAYQGLEPAPFRLTVPGGEVAREALAIGLVVWEDGKVQVEE